MSEISNDPIFIVGVHRSGTTLLRFMLSSSSRIYIPPESDFFPYFFLQNPQQALEKKDVGRMLAIVFERYRFVREWKGEKPQLEAFLELMPDRSPAAFLDALYSLYAQQYGAVRWGDKTPIYTSYIDLIHEIFPRARFIHIIRDGRDVALSMLDKWGDKEFHVDTYYAARTWVRRIRQAQASGGWLGKGHYLELKYEELVSDPEASLLLVCEFLDEPFSEEMAAHHRMAREMIAAGDFHDPVRSPPNKSRISRWKGEIADRDLRLFQRVAGDLIAELGYEQVDPGTMGTGESLRYWLLLLKYEILQAGRRVLQAFGLMPPI